MKKAVINTKVYQSLDSVRKNTYKSKHQLSEIEHHYTVAKNRGTAWWLENFKPRPVQKAIVEELLNQNI